MPPASAGVAAPGLSTAGFWPFAPPRFLVGPVYDAFFFYLSPLVAVGAALLAREAGLRAWPVALLGRPQPLEDLLLTAFIHAHLFLVFFRSHGNRAVFATHRGRFTVVPFALFLGLMAAPATRAAGLILASFWDIYHSAQQTFGLGRIYDRLAGNDLEAGRRLDRLLNHLAYTAPALAGLTIVPQLADLQPSFDELGRALFADTAAYARAWRPWLSAALLAIGIPFVSFYVLGYARLVRAGYRVSWPKVLLLSSNTIVSVWAWATDPFGRAFLIVNFFHALQYFGLVAFTERERLAPLVPIGASALPRSLLVVCGFGFTYGLFAAVVAQQPFGSAWSVTGALYVLTLVVSLLHFWYDGFVWSVRRGQV